MNTPLVSVVIPVRNYEKYIAAAIESILAQEFKDWELIIVDDYSADRTTEIASRFQDGKKIKFIRNDHNLGQFPTHNRGAELARGKYLKFFHGDDVMYPHCLRKMVEGMEAFPEAGLGISQPPRAWLVPHLFSAEEVWRAQTCRQTGMLSEGPSGTIFRTEAFHEAGRFDARFHTSDSEMNYRMALNHSILLLPDGLWWYRIHEAQVSQTLCYADRAAAETVIWYRELLADCRNPLTMVERARLDRHAVRDFWRLVLRRASQGKIREAVWLWQFSKQKLRDLPLAFSKRQHSGGQMGTMTGKLFMRVRKGAFAAAYYIPHARRETQIAAKDVCYCVLAYHGISEAPQPLFTSKRLFENHLKLFARWGSIATMDEVARFLAGERIPDGPKLRFVITFDDGYANVVRNAVPLLRRHGWRATVYVNPDWVEKSLIPWCFWMAGTQSPAPEIRLHLSQTGFGGYACPADAQTDAWPSYLFDDIIRNVAQESFDSWWGGVTARFHPPQGCTSMECRAATWNELESARDVLDIGSHTYSHAILGLCADESFMRTQVLQSKAAIEERLSCTCKHFAYPRGRRADYNEASRKLITLAGHQTAATAVDGFTTSATDPFEIPRFYVSETAAAELAAEITGLRSRWDRAMNNVRLMIRS